MCAISLADVPNRLWKFAFWPADILEDILENGITLKYANGRLFPFLYLNMWTRFDAEYVRMLCTAKKGIEQKTSKKIFVLYIHINVFT